MLTFTEERAGRANGSAPPIQKNGLGSHIIDGARDRAPGRVGQGRQRHRRISHAVIVKMHDALADQVFANVEVLNNQSTRELARSAVQDLLIERYTPPAAIAIAANRIQHHLEAAEAEMAVLASYAPARVRARYRRIERKYCREVESAIAALR
jgi:hypothetical protein